jgi:hypothetical protein
VCHKCDEERMEVRRQQQSHQVKKDDKNCIFNIKINTSRGILFAVRIDNKNEVTAATEDQGNAIKPTKTVNINDSYIILVHLSEKMTTMTAKRLGWYLTRGKQKSIHCAIGKGRQTNVNKRALTLC